MGLREKINQNKSLGILIAVILVLGAGSLLAWTMWPQHTPAIKQAWYTVDDGATWFTDSNFRVPPYDYGGKQAVKVGMYTDSKGNKFAGYLFRYDADGKKVLDGEIAEAAKHGDGPDTVSFMDDPRLTYEVKKPGANNKWFSNKDVVGARKVMEVTVAPDGGSCSPEYMMD